VLTTVALDTDPQSGPDTRNDLKLAARSGRVAGRLTPFGLPSPASRCSAGRRAVLVRWPSFGALARAPGGAHEGASESA